MKSLTSIMVVIVMQMRVIMWIRVMIIVVLMMGRIMDKLRIRTMIQ